MKSQKTRLLGNISNQITIQHQRHATQTHFDPVSDFGFLFRLELLLPWEDAVVVATVLGDFPLAWADWLVVETVVLVDDGELVKGRWPAALVIVASLPSGFVPYCTGWNNLIGEEKKN